MLTTTTISETRSILDEARSAGATVGVVPTMGYLHDGHASLMVAARAECDLVVVTIFVNPLQFGVGEDLDAYPRDIEGDTRLAEAHGVGVLFTPDRPEMYPGEVLTSISVAEVSSRWEGASRPTHFAGVATVVAKLFNIVGPCRAYFGAKDWQQVAVIRRMVADLSAPVEVIDCPTLRAPDGLALSSRNVYLDEAQRAAAPTLHRALQAGAGAIAAGERDPSVVEATMAAVLEAEPLADLDYVAVVDAATLAPPSAVTGSLRLLGAARFGRARLIDNIGVEVEPSAHGRAPG